MAGNDVRVVITADSDQAVRKIKEVGTTTEKMGTQASKAGSALGDVFKIAGGVVLSQGLMKLPGLLSGMVGGASDLNESLSKVNTVFGSSAKEIETWAGTAAKSLGMSKQAALEAAGTFGNFLQAMGATTPEATKMSKGMVQLATDLGSFNNADPTEVLLALRSGLSGEAEPLRKFGVALSAAAVNAKALEMGLKPVGKEFTEQQKIAARYAIIMEQTSMAQGDFARTSGGLANQTKILKAMFSDVSTEIGQALLPGIVKLAAAVIQVVPFVIALGQEIGGRLKEGIAAVAPAVVSFATAVGDLAGLAWDKISGPLSAFSDALVNMGTEAVTKAISFVAETLVPAIKVLAEISWEKITEGFDSLAGVLEKITSSGQVETLKAQVAALSAELRVSGTDTQNWVKAWQTVSEKLQPAIDLLKPLVEQLLREFKQAVIDIGKELGPLGAALKDVGEALKPLQPLIEPIAKLLGTALVLAIAALIETFRLMVFTIKTEIIVAIGLLTVAIETIATVLSTTIAAVKASVRAMMTAWEEVLNPVINFITEWGVKLLTAFNEAVNPILGVLTELAQLVLTKAQGIGTYIIDGIKAGISNGFEAFKSWVQEKLNPMNWGWRSPLDHSMWIEAYEAGEEVGAGLYAGVDSGMDQYGPLIEAGFIDFFVDMNALSTTAGGEAGAAYAAAFASAAGSLTNVFSGNLPSETPPPTGTPGTPIPGGGNGAGMVWDQALGIWRNQNASDYGGPQPGPGVEPMPTYAIDPSLTWAWDGRGWVTVPKAGWNGTDPNIFPDRSHTNNPYGGGAATTGGYANSWYNGVGPASAQREVTTDRNGIVINVYANAVGMTADDLAGAVMTSLQRQMA